MGLGKRHGLELHRLSGFIEQVIRQDRGWSCPYVKILYLVSERKLGFFVQIKEVDQALR